MWRHREREREREKAREREREREGERERERLYKDVGANHAEGVREEVGYVYADASKNVGMS